MNRYMTELSQMIPACSAVPRKLDKLSILRMAVEHMKRLRGTVMTSNDVHVLHQSLAYAVYYWRETIILFSDKEYSRTSQLGQALLIVIIYKLYLLPSVFWSSKQ